MPGPLVGRLPLCFVVLPTLTLRTAHASRALALAELGSLLSGYLQRGIYIECGETMSMGPLDKIFISADSLLPRLNRTRPASRSQRFQADLPGGNLARRRPDRHRGPGDPRVHGIECDHVSIRTSSYTGN